MSVFFTETLQSFQRPNVKFVETPTREKAKFWEMCLICCGQVENRSSLQSCLAIRSCVFYAKPHYSLSLPINARRQELSQNNNTTSKFLAGVGGKSKHLSGLHYKNPISSCLLFIQDSGGAASHGEIMQEMPQISRELHSAKNDSLFATAQQEGGHRAIPRELHTPGWR